MDRCKAKGCKSNSGWYWWLAAVYVTAMMHFNKVEEYLPKVQCVAVQAEVDDG